MADKAENYSASADQHDASSKFRDELGLAGKLEVGSSNLNVDRLGADRGGRNSDNRGTATNNGEYVVAFNMGEHKKINDKVLGDRLGSPALYALDVGNISQDASWESTGKMEHHFCDDSLQASLKYTDDVQQNIAKKLAKPQLNEDDLVDIMRQVGQRMHTLQDFYAHSNYTELKLNENPRLQPKDIPLENWDEIRNGKAPQLRTGFYFYQSPGVNELFNQMTRAQVIERLESQGKKIPGTKYASDFIYEDRVGDSFQKRLDYATNMRYSVLHRDTAKDDDKDDEGKVVNPNTGKNLFQYARDLGLRETDRQWTGFEDLVHDVRGQESGDAVLARIKNISTNSKTWQDLKNSKEGIITDHATMIS